MTSSTANLGGTFTTAGLGTFSNSGGTVNLTGTLNNTGATLALNSSTIGSWQLDNGTINAGTISTTGSATLIGVAGTLNGVILAGTLNLLGGGSVTITNNLMLSSGLVELASNGLLNFTGTQMLGGTGDVVFSDSSFSAINVTGNGNVWTIGPNVTIHGNSGEILAGASSFINEGTISADTGAGEILVDGNFSNAGAVNAANGSTLVLGQTSGHGTAGTFTNSGTITGVTGFIFIAETLNNVGSTLALTAATGPIYLVLGTIQGGTISTTGGAAIIGANDGGTLSGVTLAGTLDLTSSAFASAYVTVTGGLTLNQGSINLAGARSLIFNGTQNLSGTGTVTLSNASSNNFLVPNAGDTLTIMPGITVQGNSGVVGSSGGGLITNQATIEATGGGSLTVQGFTNFAGGTLTGGAWEAVGGSTLRLVGATITTNAASILLDGAAANIYSGSTGTTNALAAFATNSVAGSFTIQNGANFTSGGAFTNAGTLTVGSGDAFAPGGTFTTTTGGVTHLQGGTLGPVLPPESTSLSFNGSSDSVSVGNLGARPTQGTISFWMKPAVVANYENVLTTGPTAAGGAGGNQAIRFEENSTGALSVTIGNSTANTTTGFTGFPLTSSLAAGIWVQVTLTWNSSTNQVQGYLDGAGPQRRDNLADQLRHSIWPRLVVVALGPALF